MDSGGAKCPAMQLAWVILVVACASACRGRDKVGNAETAGSAATGSSAASSAGRGSAEPTANPAAAELTPAYQRDVERICDVVTRAGAAGLSRNDQTYLTATWLSQNLESDDARGFLARIRSLDGAAKADALDGEARRAGLTRCALADDWRQARPEGAPPASPDDGAKPGAP
jgi:hypothetical protein